MNGGGPGSIDPGPLFRGMPGTVAAGAARPEPCIEEKRMAVRVRTTGCLFSIVASIVLTIVLNLLLRACSSGGY